MSIVRTPIRIKCFHAVSRDASARPHEILKLKIKDIEFKFTPDKTKQYAEILVNGKTGSRHIPLFNSIPYIKDYLDHEHPHSTNPNAPFICGTGKSLGRPILESTLLWIYSDYKKDLFPKLLGNNKHSESYHWLSFCDFSLSWTYIIGIKGGYVFRPHFFSFVVSCWHLQSRF